MAPTGMSKAFWQGFREGYMKFFWVGIAFAIGIAVGSYAHPYETCKRKYLNIDDNILECVWLLENQPALR